jgi:aminoglycoside phosphotransferase (APT) family kinase protein
MLTASGTPVVGKLFPEGDGALSFQNMVALWHSSFGERRDPPGLARPVEYLTDLRVLVMEQLPGRPLAEGDYASEDALRAAVELLVSLHGSDAVLATRPRSAARIVRSLRRKAAWIAEVAPAYAPPYRVAVDAVEAAQPEDSELVCCHGDFSPRNVLVAPDRHALIDWDRLRLADPARDVAHFGAWCWLRSLHDREIPDWSALDRFLGAYSSLRPGAALKPQLDFHVSAALLRMVAARVELWREEHYLIPRLIDEALRRVR